MIWDCFIFSDELDMLECRLTELDGAVDRFVLVESRMTFQNKPKPLHFQENRERFAHWLPFITHVIVDRLCGDDAWARESSQRDHISDGLFAAHRDDLILLSDVDEIPTRESISRVCESGFTVFEQRFFCFAVDWEHPDGWPGTSAARKREITSFSEMRGQRIHTPRIRNAGWHLSWLGGRDANLAKLASFSHTELVDSIRTALVEGRFLAAGQHVDGVQLAPVEVDANWPRYVVERRCPENWFRPRPEKKEMAMTKTWNEAWPLVDAIEGWLTEAEAKTLYDLARCLDGPLIAVELGAFKGRSSAAIALGLRAREEQPGRASKLVSVDLWQNDTATLDGHVARLSLLGLREWLHWVPADTAHAASMLYSDLLPNATTTPSPWNNGVSLLFIDADHSYEAVLRDFEAWSPRVRIGGHIAFHDSGADGPSRVIGALPGWYEKVDHAGSLSVFRKR